MSDAQSVSIKTVPATKAKAAKRSKPAKRRGARVESDEGEDAVANDPAQPESESDSDFTPPEPEDDDDRSDSDGDDQLDPKTPVAGSVEELNSKETVQVKSTLEGPPVPLSWSDLPAPGDGSIDDLPVLDFSSLSVAGITSLPSSSSIRNSPLPSTATPTAPKLAPNPLSKKSQSLAKRLAKSEEAKLKDPVAWEVAEEARKARELEKKVLKKERTKEKRREFRAANAVAAAVPVEEEKVVEPVKKALPTGPAPRLINAAFSAPRKVVPSRPSKTSLALAANSTPAAESSWAEDVARIPVDVATPRVADSTPTAGSSWAEDVGSIPARNHRGPAPRAAVPGPSNDQNGNNGDNATPYFQAREAYTTRLAVDPSYTPRIGKFWSHDERLMEPELRGLAPYWRGRGRGGEVRGARGGAGRGRGGTGRGGSGSGGWGGGYSGESSQGEQAEEGQNEEPVEIAIKGIADAGAGDGWGRGEEKRATKNAVVQTFLSAESATASSWNHDGYEELQAPRPPPVPRQPSNRRVDVGEPGTINPRYAHLPYHPAHRFPAAPLPVASLPPTAIDSVRPPLPPKEPIVEAAPAPAVVRLPGSEAAPVAASLPAPVSAPAVEPVEALPPMVQEKREERNVEALHATNPDRRTESPYGAAPPNGYFHQLPPHLQQQQQQQQQQQAPLSVSAYRNSPQFVDSRHASPVYYPQFYAPDNSFPLMHTPGVTPPPIHFPNNQPAAFFVPPRQSKIEIKAPGPDYSPRPVKTTSPPSGAGEAARGGSPAVPFSAIKSNFATNSAPMGGEREGGRMGGGQGVPYGYQPSGEYVDSNGMVYFPPQPHQQQPQQSPYSSYAPQQHQQQQYQPDPYSYYQPQQQQPQQSYRSQPQQYSDPSILSMGIRQHHQQQQPYGYPNRYE